MAVAEINGARDERVFVAVLISIAMLTAIVSSLGAPLIPSVARTLHVSLDAAQWSLTAALMTAAVTAPILGRLGDGPHRRAALLGGLAVVLLGSVLAGVAGSLPVLLAGRVMQGVGLGLVPTTMAAARDHLPADRAGPTIQVLSVSAAAAVGAGYPISGLVDRDLGLHAAFLVGAVLSAAALIAAWRVVPRSSASATASLDRPGALLLSLTLVMLIVAIAQGARWGWTSGAVLALFAAGIAGAALWVVQQLRGTHPLVELRQLTHRGVLTADLAAFGLSVAMYMYITCVTEFIQEPRSVAYGLGASSLTAGLALVPFTVLGLPMSRLNPWLARHVGETAILVGGSFVIAAAGAFFALAHTGVWEAFVTMGLLGAGFGFTFAAIPGIITSAVPDRETGSALGLYQVIRYVGFSLGSALAATILASHTTGRLVHESGYVTALWIGATICVVAAVSALALSRRPA